MNSKQLLDEIVQSTERLSARVDSFAADQSSGPGFLETIMGSLRPKPSQAESKPEPPPKTFSANPSPSQKLLPKVEWLDSVAASVAKLTPRIDAFCGRSDADRDENNSVTSRQISKEEADKLGRLAWFTRGSGCQIVWWTNVPKK